MEEEDLTKTLDPIAQTKHAAMIERLSNLHQSRLQQSICKKSSDSDSVPSFESTQSFLNRFSESKRSIENELDRIRLITDSDTKSRLKYDIEKVSVAIGDLEKLVAENSYFLPAYEVRSSLKTISELKETLEIVNLELFPRKKFMFRNKPTKKEPINVVTVTETRDLNEVSAEKSNFAVRDSPGFKNKEGAILVKEFGFSEEGDFILSDLISCKIHLKGCLRALFIHRLRNCRVFVGPVLGSIHIEEVEGCIFMLASHQIRIHQAKGTDFYLRVKSRPIIEDGCGVRFAPYLLFYEGIEKELRDSGLGEETGNWANVDDFRWLRAVQSPNWCVLPEEERVSKVNISDSKPQNEDS
ncbi:C-CAP/cofactor C-like domain-containing protein [Tasmannia lanceolata]|uniref:C-CAP/cofactor C-like domain-containing protein n=1 Tax=Tasmannia lanceolata TaxID=3420 RepID=UPI00406490FA